MAQIDFCWPAQVVALLYEAYGLTPDETNCLWVVLSAERCCAQSVFYAFISHRTDGVIVRTPNGLRADYGRRSGQPFDKVFLTHEQLVNCGEIIFDMASAPDHYWAIAPASRPPATIPGTTP